MTFPIEPGRKASIRRQFSRDDIRGFAALADCPPGDLDHVPEPLIAALFSYLLGVKLPGPGTNYLKQELEFLQAAPLDAVLSAEVTVTALRPEKHLCDLATLLFDETGQVLARGRALVLIRDVARTP